MQYRRAIQLYYRKFHAYPPNVEALINTNDIRFLRKKYIDPITGKDDWKPIAFGQNKTPTAMGFFGQPLAGNASTLAGIGPSGGGVGIPAITTPGSAPGGTFGGSSGSGGIFGSSDSGNGQSSPAGASGSTDTSGGSSGTPNGTDNSGASGSTGSTFSSGTSSTGAGSNSAAPTFGGAGIIGFSPASPKTSILVYKKKQHYNEWEFTYDPLSDMKTIGGGTTGLATTNPTNPTTPPGTPTPGPGPNPTPTMPPDTPAPQ
jgi:hypothetical protein